MIAWNGNQGTDDWHGVREGIPTASCFGKILTASTLKPSSSQRDYLNQLVAESVGAFERWGGNAATERGHELEDMAVAYYEIIEDVDAEEVGFVWRDESKVVGVSPDRLIGENGGLEVKCPGGKKHVANVLGGKVPSEHLAQVYGCLWLTGRQWWDFISYHTEFEKQLIVRTTADDEKYVAWRFQWEPELEKFLGRLEEARFAVTGKCELPQE